MSLLSPDSLLLYISPDKVQGVRTTGWRTSVVAMQQVDVTTHAVDGWLGMAQACNQILAEQPSKRVRVLLSDKLVRYFCFAWREDLRGANEIAAFAKLTLDDIYGVEEGQEWRIGLSDEGHGASRLAVAVPEGLFRTLQGCCDAARANLCSVKSHFSALVQAYQHVLPDKGWLVAHENGRMTYGSWGRKGWQSVHSVRSSVNTCAQLTEVVKREMLLAGTPMIANDLPLAYVSAPLIPDQTSPEANEAVVRYLPALKLPAMEVPLDELQALAFAMPLFGVSA